MRALGLIGLLLALAIVGLLVKQQLKSTGMAAAPAGQAVPAGGNVREQSQQIQQQFKQSLDAAMKQPRATPDEANQ
jgi:hypothetical protein